MEPAMTVALILGVIGLLCLLIYRRATRNYGYWESIGVTTIKPSFLFGSTEDTFYKPPNEMEDERIRKYGKIYGAYEFFTRTISIADPELAHQVLIKDFHLFTNRRSLKTGILVMDSAMTAVRDETWKRIRSVVSPSFTSGKMRKMNAYFVEAAEALIQNLLSVANSEEKIDAKYYFSSYSLDVIGLCAFGIRVDSLKNPDHPLAVVARKMFSRDVSKLGMLMFFMPGMSKIFGSYILKKMGFDYFVKVCSEIIQKRKVADQQSNRVDLIQLMLDAREGKLDNDDKEELNNEGHFYQDSESGVSRPAWNITKTLSDVEIHAQTTQIFSAGHETTSTTISLAVYELAENPDIQERVYQEVKDIYDAHGEFNYDIVKKMTYLEAVICETLRLYTIVTRVEREASQDYMLGSTGILVPKGALVLVLVHAIHHDPEYYPEPYKFDPDRFLPENRSSLTPYTFLAFGDGPRNCVAMRFALLEIKLCLAMVIRKIKFLPVNEQKEPVSFFHSPGLLIPRYVNVKVEKRT